MILPNIRYLNSIKVINQTGGVAHQWPGYKSYPRETSFKITFRRDNNYPVLEKLIICKKYLLLA